MATLTSVAKVARSELLVIAYIFFIDIQKIS